MRTIIYLYAEEIASYLEEPSYVKNWYHFEAEWLDEWKSKDKEGKIHSILEVGFGPLSLCKSSEKYLNLLKVGQIPQHLYDGILMDEDDHLHLCRSEFRDPNRVEHYVWYHMCVQMVVFTFELTQLIFPEREFVIVWNGDHAYVREKDDYETIYDIILYTIPTNDITTSIIYQPDGKYKEDKVFKSVLEYMSSNIWTSWDKLEGFYRAPDDLRLPEVL